MISSRDASDLIVGAVNVTREDVARAKDYIVNHPNESGTQALADLWIRDQVGDLGGRINLDDQASAKDGCQRHGRSYGLRLSFYQAAWELIAAAVLLPAGPPVEWLASDLTGDTSHGGDRISLGRVKGCYPGKIARSWIGTPPAADADLLLHGSALPSSLDPGILEGVRQSLACFQRGLYLPAIAMLAAAAEGTWSECAVALATHLGDARLAAAAADPYVTIGQLVGRVGKALQQPAGKALLKTAGVTKTRVDDAELWTTTLRERRNALHWGKAASFVAQHSEAGTLLLAAPQHLETLEKIRAAC